MNIYYIKINEFKHNLQIFNDFINNYFNVYKRPLLKLGYYNYNALQIDCRANSYIENYNLFLKKNLGKKYDLNWDLFINFLKKESSRIRDKLTV